MSKQEVHSREFWVALGAALEMSVPFNQHIFPKDQQPLHAEAWISNNIFSSVMRTFGSTDILRKNNSYKIIFTRFYFLAPCFLMVVPNQPFIALCRRKKASARSMVSLSRSLPLQN